MTEKDDSKGDRAARLAAALRENLRKRKAQARGGVAPASSADQPGNGRDRGSDDPAGEA